MPNTPPSARDSGGNMDLKARSRDAVATRALLLRAGRRRFARDGYSSTRVRDVAADAGVNAALINRYFGSKMGLFEACLVTARDGLGQVGGGAASLHNLVDRASSQISGTPTGDTTLMMLLLLRSSGHEEADRIRRNTLTSIAERMSLVAGWEPEQSPSDDLMLRAQVALSMMMGMALLRASSMELQPVRSAGIDDLAGPLDDVIRALLAPDERPIHR